MGFRLGRMVHKGIGALVIQIGLAEAFPDHLWCQFFAAFIRNLLDHGGKFDLQIARHAHPEIAFQDIGDTTLARL